MEDASSGIVADCFQTPILHAGALTSILALQDGDTQLRGESRPVQCWLRPHRRVESILQKTLLREIGWSASLRATGILLPPERFTKQLRYQRTVRGHHFAVYCIAFDRSGRRIITGSDDRLVKVRRLCVCLAPCEAGICHFTCQ